MKIFQRHFQGLLKIPYAVNPEILKKNLYRLSRNCISFSGTFFEPSGILACTDALLRGPPSERPHYALRHVSLSVSCQVRQVQT